MTRQAEYRRRGWWSSVTAWNLFAANALVHPDRIAVSDPPNRAAVMHGAPRELSYAALQHEAEALARRLTRLGVGRGDVVVVQLPNVVESLIALLAAARVGFLYSPVPVQYREHELRYVIGKTRPKLLLTAASIDGHRHGGMAAALASEFSFMNVLAYGDGLPDAVLALDTMPDPCCALGPVPDATTRLTICWTSGTEGHPKGVVRNHQRWLCLAQAVMDAASLQPGAVLLNPFPMANMAAFVGFLLPWLRTGGTLLLHHPFSLPVFVAQLSSRPIDFTAAPPALLNLMLLRDDVASQANLGGVRVIGCGGAPLAPAMVSGFHARFGVDVVNLFGSSEGGSLVSGPNDIPDPETRAVCFPRWGVAGIEWASAMASRVETRLVNVSTGTEITMPGQAGELRFRGPGVFGEYFEAPQATAAAFDEMGYYRSGDLFEIAGDRSQYYRFVGRCKDLVIRGGVNISPEEVEGLLASHPDLAEVSVVGYADAVMGEKLCAVLVSKGQERPSLQALRSFLRDERKVAEYKLPERIEWMTSLPRNAMGKVLKRELRRLVEEPAPG